MPVRYKSNRANVELEIESQIEREVLSKTYEYEGILQGLMREPKTGRIYGAEQTVEFRTKRGATASFIAKRGKRLGKGRKGHRVHRASAPGEAPAIDSAALSKGIAHETARIGKMRFFATVGVSLQSGRAKIAEWLEFGTSKMAARPMWRPALETLRSNMRSFGSQQRRKETR